MTSAPVSTPALADLAERYLRDCRLRGLAPTTLSTYQHNLEVIFLPWCRTAGIVEPGDVTQEAVDRFAEHLMLRPKRGGRPGQLSRATVGGYLDTVRNFLVWAQRRGSGTSGRPAIPVKQRRMREILTREEVARMEDAAPSERDKLIVRLMGDRGLRLSELLLLRVQDVLEVQRGKWFLRVQGKGRGGHGEERLVPVPYLWRRLERFARTRPANCADDRMFVGLRVRRDGLYHGLTKSGVEQVIKWTARRADIDRHINPHLLRHSAITHYGSKGMNVYQLKTIFGNFSATETYMHLTPIDAHEWLSRIDA